MPRLFVLSGDDLGRAYDFDHAVVLGRGETADLRLRSVSVSRHHARVEPDPATGGWRVVDLDSRNGLAVDGRKVPIAPLTDGGVFVLGDIELRFRAEGGAAVGGAPIVLASGAPPPTGDSPDEGPRAEPTIEFAPRRAPTPPARVAADDELELEGDWMDVVPPAPTAPARPVQTQARPSRAGVPSPGDPRRAAAPGGATTAAQRDRDARRAELLRGTGAAAAPKGAAATAGGGTRPVLQYHRTEGAGGVLGADVAQRPWWMRAAVWLIGLGVLVGLAFGALELTRKLRSGEASLGAPDVGEALSD